MSDKPAKNIYTRTGDGGKTFLLTGTKVSKSSLRIAAYGDVDELSSVLGVADCLLDERKILAPFNLRAVQAELMTVASLLACDVPAAAGKLSQIPLDAVKRMEREIDEMNEQLPPLKNFILAGGSLAGSYLHVARTVCRRAERAAAALSDSGEFVAEGVAPYLNRMSDFLFVAARYVNRKQGAADLVWKPERDHDHSHRHDLDDGEDEK